MARLVMSDAFKLQQIALMDGFVRKLAHKYEFTTGEAVVKKWIVIMLTKKNITFSVIDLKCGVVKITTETHTCPRCGGTGRV